MAYVAYVFSEPDAIPYMEAIPVEDLTLAKATLRLIIAQHSKARFGELWRDNNRVLIMEPDGRLL